MNKHFVHTIYGILSPAIEKGYKEGIKQIAALNKKKFTDGKANIAVFAQDKIFSVDYTGRDLKAIENFKLSVFKQAGVGSYQLEQELKELGVKVHKNELDKEAYEIAVRKAMLKYGIELGSQPPSGWIKQALDMAIKSSIEGARWNRVTDPALKGLYSHWIYRTQNDDAVRPAHQKLEGRMFSIADRIASRMIPPDDWGCRCFPEYVTKEESGEHKESSGSSYINEVPEDFRYNPGNGRDIYNRWLEQKFKDMPSSELDKLQKLIDDEF